jgi:hypothetical protein
MSLVLAQDLARMMMTLAEVGVRLQGKRKWLPDAENPPGR